MTHFYNTLGQSTRRCIHEFIQNIMMIQPKGTTVTTYCIFTEASDIKRSLALIIAKHLFWSSHQPSPICCPMERDLNKICNTFIKYQICPPLEYIVHP